MILGGGSPKNFALQTEPQIQEVLGIDEKGHAPGDLGPGPDPVAAPEPGQGEAHRAARVAVVQEDAPALTLHQVVEQPHRVPQLLLRLQPEPVREAVQRLAVQVG